MTLTSAQIRELAAAATPGPWSVERDDDGGASIEVYGPQHVVAWLSRLNSRAPVEDAALIAAMRNALPELLAALELREACERLGQEQGTTIIQLEGPCMDGTRWRGSRSRLRNGRGPTLASLIVALAGRT